jgi:hypothetical protein
MNCCFNLWGMFDCELTISCINSPVRWKSRNEFSGVSKQITQNKKNNVYNIYIYIHITSYYISWSSLVYPVGTDQLRGWDWLTPFGQIADRVRWSENTAVPPKHQPSRREDILRPAPDTIVASFGSPKMKRSKMLGTRVHNGELLFNRGSGW